MNVEKKCILQLKITNKPNGKECLTPPASTNIQERTIVVQYSR